MYRHNVRSPAVCVKIKPSIVIEFLETLNINKSVKRSLDDVLDVIG